MGAGVGGMVSVPTIVFASGLVALTTGVLLGVSWLQNRQERSLQLWALANLAGALAASLAFARVWFDSFAFVHFAHAASILAVGLGWAGTRHFERRPFTWLEVFAGSLVWTVAGLIPAGHASPLFGVVASSCIIAAYMSASAFTHWQGRGERLVSRWPAIVLLGACATIYMMRAPLAYAWGVPTPEEYYASPLVAFVASVALVHVIGVSFLRLAMVRERAEANYRRVASTDQLTGIANRRAFLEVGENRIATAQRRRETVALLVFDLDYFKAINDGFGHGGGDDVLVEFTSRVCSIVGDASGLARVGGEEFAILVYGAGEEDVFVLAEALRARIADTPFETRQGRTAVTVSIGVAFAGDGDCSLDQLMQHADMALYCAKRNGRNRIEFDRVVFDEEESAAA